MLLRQKFHRVLTVMLSMAALLLACAGARAGELALPAAGIGELATHGQLYVDDGQRFPDSPATLDAWRGALRPASAVDLRGGSYWLLAKVRHQQARTAWVLVPSDTLIEQVEGTLFGSDGSVALLRDGYFASHDYLLHYGEDVTLHPGVEYRVVLRFSSRYFARVPVWSLLPQSQYRTLVARENVIIIGSLGALLTLVLFNLFIYTITRDRSTLYYALYVLAYVAAWSLTFHMAADIFGWYLLELHAVPSFLLPVLSTMFYQRFLRLRKIAPRLWRINRINLVLPLVLLPSSFLALGWAHTLVSVVIAIWLPLALISGIAAWRSGFLPARYFVVGILALMLPGVAILPANLGLAPALVSNARMWTLLGGAFGGLLLAFALADRIRLLGATMEKHIESRTADLVRTNAELTAARDHAEVVSRHRIDFLSAMSHDIRTPLAGVIGMLKFGLQDKSIGARTQEYLRIGLHNGEALLAILNDILDFSKIDAGKLTLETVDFNLRKLVEDVVDILRGQADAKSLLLRSQFAPSVPAYVMGDPTRIRQVLINLFGNAIKFTEHGEVALQVDLVDADPARPMLRFCVTDTGPGMSEDMRARLFQKFEQGDHSTTRRYGGTGLGLAICKELVTLMKGQIGVDSAPGAGARFTFTLPLVAGSAPLAPADTKARVRHSHRLRILCAEDVRTNQIIIQTLLEHMGHHARIVENGADALKALATEDFDLVLMDGRMPVMDGEQATRLIRAGGTEANPVRDPGITILALTANVSAPDCARYLACGMNGFLGKPIDDVALFDRIDETIAQLLAAGHALPPASVDDGHALQAELELEAMPEPAARMSILPLPGLSREKLEQITRAFLDEAPRRLQAGREALAAGDAEAARNAFHSLKGSSGYLSSKLLQQLAHRMELLAAAGRIKDMEELLPQVDEAVREAVDDLSALR